MNLVPNEVYPWIAQYPQISAGLMAGNEIAKSLVGMTDTILNRPESMVDPVYLSGGMDEQKLAKLEAADPYTQMQWASALGANRHSNEPLQDVNPPEGYVVRRNAEGGLELAVKPEGTDLGHGGSAAYNTAVDLGRFMQLGSGAGPMAAPGALAVQALGEAPSALDAMGMFAGTRATNSPANQFFKHRLLRNVGYGDQEAHALTGISRPYKGQAARWEIPDNEADLLKQLKTLLPALAEREGVADIKNTPLHVIMRHKQLYEAYPELKDIKASITLNPALTDGPIGAITANMADLSDANMRISGATVEDILSGLLHESQHAVQHLEDWPSGTGPKSILNSALGEGLAMSPDEAFARYQGHQGEVEARNTQVRQQFTGPQRRAIYPHVTQDVVPGSELLPDSILYGAFPQLRPTPYSLRK